MDIPTLFIGILILSAVAPLAVSLWVLQKYRSFRQKTFLWITIASLTSSFSYFAQIPISFDWFVPNQTYDLSIGFTQVLSQISWTMVGVNFLTDVIHENKNISNSLKKRQSFLKVIRWATGTSIIFISIWTLSILLSFFIQLPKIPYPLIQLVANTMTLLVLEQFWTNSNDTSRWQSKFVIVAATMWSLLNILYHSQKSLLISWSWNLELARMVLNILILPLLVIGIERINNNKFRFKVSHQLAFRTTSLLLVGIYLLLTAAGGFYIQKFNLKWVQFFQILFILCASITLAFLIISARIRGQVIFFINRHFINDKYDYRSLWLNLSDRLSRSEPKVLEEVSIQAFLDLVESEEGYLWRIKNDHYELTTQIKSNLSENHSIVFKKNELIIKELTLEKIVILENKNNNSTTQNKFQLDKKIVELNIWFFVPLMIRKDLIGIIGIGKSRLSKNIDQEDQNLLINFGRQIAAIIFQQEAIEKLSDNAKFKAVSQFSAFLIHDLKTIIAQLQLLINNAERHRKDPVFFNDMISTVSHATHKMDRILKSLRNLNQPEISTISSEFKELIFDPMKIIEESTTDSLIKSPQPILKSSVNDVCYIKGNPENFKMALIHIIQNAKEASFNRETIEIHIVQKDDHLLEVRIIDFGIGMSNEFIKHNLFRPFVSSKGLTGMGIGAFQSKEIIESMGGNLSVNSEENKGSTFTITLPILSSNLQ